MLRVLAAGFLAALLSMLAMAVFISGGPPTAQELVEVKTGLVRVYDALAAEAADAARALKREYCAREMCGAQA